MASSTRPVYDVDSAPGGTQRLDANSKAQITTSQGSLHRVSRESILTTPGNTAWSLRLCHCANQVPGLVQVFVWPPRVQVCSVPAIIPAVYVYIYINPEFLVSILGPFRTSHPKLRRQLRSSSEADELSGPPRIKPGWRSRPSGYRRTHEVQARLYMGTRGRYDSPWCMPCVRETIWVLTAH